MNPKTLIIAGVAIVLNFVTVGTGAGAGLLLPLVPLATITGHGGLYASGMTSAALLKLKAVSAIAALAGLTESGFHFKLGHGWLPSEHHHNIFAEHHGGHGWGRKRRSTDETEAVEETVAVDMSQYDPSFDEVAEYDQLGCGMRMVCELASTPRDQLADDGKLILELFGRDGKAPNPEKASKGKLTYTYASLLGENAKDASACSRVYARCPYSSQEILAALRSANV